MDLNRFAPAAAALLTGALLGLAPPSLAQSNAAAEAPWSAKAARAEMFRAPEASAAAARIELAAPESVAIETLKSANARAHTKRLDVGIGREVDDAAAGGAALQWVAVQGGHAAHWRVRSLEARALRIAIRARGLDPGVEMRFAGDAQPGIVYGPMSAADIEAGGPVYWSPVLEGDTATVEVFVPTGSALPEVNVERLSHLFASPADPRAEANAKAAGPCEVNLICRSAADASLTQIGRAVARMTYTLPTGASTMCSGTLLNPSDGSFTPYFYSAAHCISTAGLAKTLTTHWFYETAGCTGTALNPANVQVPGGSTLLYADEFTDVLFVRLNAQPPANAVYSGWDAATLRAGVPIVAVHHPDGDVKKVSLGSIGGFDVYPTQPGSFVRVRWNGTATGVVEPGSSGSGLFTGDAGSGYRLRGGLLGGPSSCTQVPNLLYDEYSRLDLAFPYLSQHLSPAFAPALGSNATPNPGFEGGASGWTQSSSSSAALITNDASAARSGSWYAWLGGAHGVTETLSQALTIPEGPARLQFWYRVESAETTTALAFDTLTIAILNATTGEVLRTIGTLSNLDATASWIQSSVMDVSAFNGQAVRLRFRAVTDASNITSFRIDDVTVNGTAASIANNTALWFNANESGWGINVTQQGNIAFATLFTYDSTGAPMWLVMPAGVRQNGGETFLGALYRTTGSPFSTNPFPPIGPANITEVGTMTVDFAAGQASIGYDMNEAYVAKSVQKQVFGAAAANCTATTGSRAGSTNYQDLWWNPAESGWGINLTHQGNTIFATLFTYATNSQGLWLVLPAGVRQSDGSYLGELYRTTGPAFNAVPFTPIGPGNITQVGTMRLRFTNGESGTLEYSVNGTNVTKAITRQVFSSPLPLCTS